MSTADIAPPPAVAAPPPAAAPIAPPGVQPNAPVAAPVAPPVVAAPDAAAVAAKAAADAAAAPFDVKYPEGFAGDPAQLEAFKPLAKELGLDAAKAQKLVDFVAANAKAQETAALQRDAKWVESIKADKEIGGANFDRSAALAQRAVLKFGGQELVDAFAKGDLVGLGNNPALVKAWARIGRAMAEDSVSGTSGAPAAANDEERHLREMFPNSPTMWARAKP